MNKKYLRKTISKGKILLLCSLCLAVGFFCYKLTFTNQTNIYNRSQDSVRKIISRSDKYEIIKKTQDAFQEPSKNYDLIVALYRYTIDPPEKQEDIIAMMQLCETMLKDGFVIETEKCLESFAYRRISGGEDIEIEPLELLRKAYAYDNNSYQYKRFLDSIPDDYKMKPALLREASYYFCSEGEFETAHRILDNGISANLDKQLLKTALAELYKAEKNYDAAINELKSVLTLNETGRGYYELANLYLVTGNYDDAKESFRNAINLEPEIIDEIKADLDES